jgi:lipopolysaccharide export system protein LptC
MSLSASPPELHLPDLPEVHVALGQAPDRPPQPRLSWGYRLQLLLSSYLPLLLMALLALSTWWLVKNTPHADEPRPAAEVRKEPDYEMKGFAVTRFAADGQVKVRLEGDTMRHFPDTDRIEIDTVRIQALGPGGRVTNATARQALANGDATEVQLRGGARVQASAPGAETVVLESDFLHAFLATELVKTDKPVRVRQGRSDAHAAGLEADLLNRHVELKGPVRLAWLPRGQRALPPGAEAATDAPGAGPKP